MKKFLIIGNGNAVTYKDIFPLIKDNKMWLGSKGIGVMGFLSDGKLKNIFVCWLTNLDHKKHNEPLNLNKKYTPDEYPKYDNYDAIEVSKVKNIPYDYSGVMGVPISFLDKYCPTQFEIIGCPDADITPKGWKGMSQEFVDLYYAQGNTGQYQKGKRLAHYVKSNGKVKVPYKRLLIRRNVRSK